MIFGSREAKATRRDQKAAARRHSLLMRTVTSMARDKHFTLLRNPAYLTPDQVAAQVFGIHAIRLTETEATDYLRAALTLQGHTTAHLPAALANTTA
ncbi:hypothetical protein OTB20_40620 [Streptomyces sp. H27-H1]|uniref:hypothetical protein n=1 Tax=Streptomyces sp. H27-H1 TaxID=2996461 RepID=UPI002270564D|nr:hypothetical protein [Streptomyces sp. H27-H1]MCY0932348.1 hypothetical protein [Streptomyces sp. H27-H1]